MHSNTQELATPQGQPPSGSLPPAQWPAHRAVAWLPGSLPMGGIVPNTPIHAFETEPSQLQGALGALPPKRHDIALGGLLAFVIDNVISHQLARQLIAVSERFGYSQAAPGISTPPGMRMNKSVHWIADTTLMQAMFEHIGHLLPHEIEGRTLHAGFSQRINMYRYDNQDVFNRHTDGSWPGYGLSPDRLHMVQWSGLRSGLTMLLYLNDERDGFKGGHTRLFAPNGDFVDCAPRQGSALFFRHGFGADSVMHEGRAVFGPQPKYVARINVMYQP